MISLDTGLWQRGPSSSFNPLSLSPALWLDASDASTLYQSNGGAAAAADGDPVGYITDKSGNSKTLSQTSGTNKPLLKLALQNGKNVVRFNGTSSWLTMSLAQSSPSSIYLVANTTSMGIGNRTFLNRATVSSPYPPALYFGLNTTNYKPSIFWGTTNIVQVSNPVTKAAIFKFRLSPTDAAILIDGGTETTVTHSQTVLSTWTQFAEIANYPAAFDLCECLIINGTVSAANNTAVLNYLNSKWAIY